MNRADIEKAVGKTFKPEVDLDELVTVTRSTIITVLTHLTIEQVNAALSAVDEILDEEGWLDESRQRIAALKIK